MKKFLIIAFVCLAALFLIPQFFQIFDFSESVKHKMEILHDPEVSRKIDVEARAVFKAYGTNWSFAVDPTRDPLHPGVCPTISTLGDLIFLEGEPGAPPKAIVIRFGSHLHSKWIYIFDPATNATVSYPRLIQVSSNIDIRTS